MCKRRMHLGWGACGSSWPARGWIADLLLARWDEEKRVRKGRQGKGSRRRKKAGDRGKRGHGCALDAAFTDQHVCRRLKESSGLA